MLHTTFRRLKLAGACGQDSDTEGYGKLAAHLGGTRKYGVNTPIPLTTILESNGLDDTLWCLRAVVEDADREIRLLACDYAEHVLPLFEAEYPGDNRPRLTIETSRRYANRDATSQELNAALSASAADAAKAAYYAANAACYAAYAAKAAYYAANAAYSAANAAYHAAYYAAYHAAYHAAKAAYYAATGESEKEWQGQRLIEVLNGKTI